MAYLQDQKDFVAWQVFPSIPVQKASDRYWVYNKDFWFRNTAKRRAPGTESAGGGYALSRQGYLADIVALHHDIDDPTRANADSPLDLDADATMFTSRSLVLQQEVNWAANYFKTGVWATDAVPSILWSDDASTPIQDVLQAADTVESKTGFRPNKLVIPRKVLTRLKTHPDIVDRVKYTSSDSIDEDMVANLFEIDDVLIAKSVLNSAQEGLTGSYDYVMSNAVLLAYAPPTPGLRTPSAGYTFMWQGVSGGMGETVGVKKFRMEWLGSDRIESQIAYDMAVVGNDLGYFLHGVLS